MEQPGCSNVDLPEGAPEWVPAFVEEATRETQTLRENGAFEAAQARTALIEKLVIAMSGWLDTEVDVDEAARVTGVCRETIRRNLRSGHLPDRRRGRKGRYRIRRGDLRSFDARGRAPYDPIADAQDIATLRSFQNDSET